jgi:hypothetical protein
LERKKMGREETRNVKVGERKPQREDVGGKVERKEIMKVGKRKEVEIRKAELGELGMRVMETG